MSYEKSLVLLKPDSLKKRLVGRIISRFEDAGLDILQIQFVERAIWSIFIRASGYSGILESSMISLPWLFSIIIRSSTIADTGVFVSGHW